MKIGRFLANVALAIGLSAIPLGLAVLSQAAATSDTELDDAITHAKLKGLLVEKLGLDALSIKVDVKAGAVRLSGEVKKNENQELAQEVARSVSGVKSVTNDVRFAPESKAAPIKHAEQEIKDVALEAKLKHQLLFEIGKNALKIEVEATNGAVSLRGTVPSAAGKESALKVVRGASGVKKVIDLIHVA